jgi:hypothetical protein
MFVIGIDAGGTKTVCQLADERAQVLAEARGPGANLQANGELEVEKALHAVMAEAIGGDKSIRPSAICWMFPKRRCRATVPYRRKRRARWPAERGSDSAPRWPRR